MTKRALKRMVREGAFDADQFDDGKVRRLPVERGWTPPMQAYGSNQNAEEREQGYLKTIKPKSIGQTHHVPLGLESRQEFRFERLHVP